MKAVGIVAAVKPELDAVKEVMEQSSHQRIYDLEFWEGTVGDMRCVVVECGVGKVNAARAAQILIDRYGPDCVVNVGTAGGINPALGIGDVVISKDLVQHDYDRTALGNELARIPNLKSAYIASDPGLVEKCRRCMEQILQDGRFHSRIVIGTIVTGDVFKITAARRDELWEQFHAQCIEMEGAAIAQVCELCGVPFVAVRSLSNGISGSDRDETEFWQFRQTAARRCAQFMQAFCSLQ